MKLYNGIIYLKEPVNLEIRSSTLVHEAAHNLHFFKYIQEKDRLSRRWKELFPNERHGRDIRDVKFLEENGLIVPYAATDYNIDNIAYEPENYPQRCADFFYKGENANIYLYGQWDHEKVSEDLDSEVGNLPGMLKDVVSDVVLTPELIFHGRAVVNINVLSKLWLSVTEDIASSTELFHAAYNKPLLYKTVKNKVNSNPLTRKRLEVLVEEGFLDPETLWLLKP